MRDPNSAVARFKPWQRVGPVLRDVLDECLDQVEDHPVQRPLEKLRTHQDVSQPIFRKYLAAQAEATAMELAEALGDKGAVEEGPIGGRWKLMKMITEAAEDPDADVAEWLAGRTPLGIERPIEPRGIFPQCTETEAQRASAGYFEERTSPEVAGNYVSFKEHGPLAREELKRLLDEGHLERIGNWEQVRHRWPKALATKLAVLVNDKPDGRQTVRFIVTC